MTSLRVASPRFQRPMSSLRPERRPDKRRSASPKYHPARIRDGPYELLVLPLPFGQAAHGSAVEPDERIDETGAR